MDKEQKEFTDIPLVSFLIAAGFKPLRNTVIANRLTFIFEKNQKIEEAVNQFYSNRTRVDALTLLDVYRNLKQMLRYSKEAR